MRHWYFGLFWAIFCYASAPYAHTLSSQSALYTHVAFLSSQKLAGRLTGSKGEQMAAQYVVHLFKQLGLQPAGESASFLQPFSFIAGVKLGKHNSLLSLTRGQQTKVLTLGQDWQPLPFSTNQSITNDELIFAGYGITAPATDHLPAYDSYQNVQVKNKWVVVFRYLPEKIPPNQQHQLARFASLRYKTFLAKRHGAKGIIFVSGPNAKVKNKLIPFAFKPMVINAGIMALSINDRVANEWIKHSKSAFNSLQSLQDKLDTGQFVPGIKLQSTRLAGQIDLRAEIKQGQNILGKLKVTDKVNAPVIMLGAHVDHLGSKHDIYPGADDNASGVASVLVAATTLSQLQKQGKLQGNKDVIFAIWSGEELGLLGASHFVKNAPQPLHSTIDAYINLDMVGRLRKILILQGVASSNAWPEIIKKVQQPTAFTVMTQPDPYLPTDSTAFYLHGVPTLNFFTGAHADYHTPRDTLEQINFSGLHRITHFLINLCTTLMAKPQLMDYQAIKKTSALTGRLFRVYLGTIPDYASNAQGVKLAGVKKGSPAAVAGLKPEDVIVELAGQPIQNIYDYTFVLNALHAEESVTLVVRRRQVQVVLQIVPRAVA